MSNLHKLYIYTNFFHFYIFHSNRIAARNETPYTFSYLYGNFCSAKLHGYIVWPDAILAQRYNTTHV